MEIAVQGECSLTFASGVADDPLREPVVIGVRALLERVAALGAGLLLNVVLGAPEPLLELRQRVELLKGDARSAGYPQVVSEVWESREDRSAFGAADLPRFRVKAVA